MIFDDKIWCGLCRDNIDLLELKYWTDGDYEREEYLCPGCESVLVSGYEVGAVKRRRSELTKKGKRDE